MRFMLLVYPEGFDKAGADFAPPPEEVAAMMAFNEELQKAGVLLALDGLHPPAGGARVSFGDGAPRVTHGPFTDGRATLGGYWMIEVASQDEAIDWVRRVPIFGKGTIEIRQVFEMADFPEDVRKAAGDTPARLKAALQR